MRRICKPLSFQTFCIFKMPRRPRPTHRRPGTSAQVQSPRKPVVNVSRSDRVPSAHLRKTWTQVEEVDSDDNEEEEYSEVGSASEHEVERFEDVSESNERDEEEEIPDADVPRVAQWVGDDELDASVDEDDESGSASENETEDESHLVCSSIWMLISIVN